MLGRCQFLVTFSGERAALDVHDDDRTQAQHLVAGETQQELFVAHREVAERASNETRAQAIEVAQRVNELDEVDVARALISLELRCSYRRS